MSNHDPEGKALPPPPAVAPVNNSPYPHEYPNYPYHSYKHSSDKHWTSWLIPMIVVVEIVFFVIVMFINNCPNRNDTAFFFGQQQDRCVARYLGRLSFQPWHENPLLGPSSSTLIKVGGLQWWRIVEHRQAWRLLSAIWLHAGLIHLFVNLLSVIFIGIRLEQQFGYLRVGAIYVFSGLGGSILASVFLQGNVSVSGSAPLFGLLGAMLAELLINCSIYANKIAAVFTLVVVGAINAAVGILPHVGNFANIGGFAIGFFLGFILLIRAQHGWEERRDQTGHRIKSKYKFYQLTLWTAALILLIAGFAVGLVMLFAEKKNGNKHCSWCHYLNCVPTSKWDCNRLE